ncbi:TonB-dependent receptor [Dyella sp. A6]|uniref:TonB-dependent receptor n=1 Tax=Dyella aluminiiresistens TaxID=3069105 RepID=UPI002E761DCF|nr:TonB-dependent receptor [Dyella sp. A6]
MFTRRTSIQLSGLALAILATLHGNPARAADTAASGAPAPAALPSKDKAKSLQTISVVATGQTRQVQTIGQEDIRAAPPGTSALKVLNELPGVNFQSSDPWGAYEWSTSISLHGFDQSRLGFTLDNIPLGTMSYAVTNGLQITRAISSDNIASVQLAQGAGALGTPSSSNLGGTVQFYSADPDEKAGIRVDQAIGSDNTHRTYVRLDTGDFHGFSMYVSYDHANTDKWKGYGSQRSNQANLKAVYQWGNGNRISLFADSSRRKEYDYQDLSLTSQRVLGWNFDYYQPDWNKAVQVAKAYQTTGQYNGVANGYPDSLAGLPANYDWLDADYYAGGGIRHDNLAGLSGSFNFGDNLTWNVGTYYHGDRGEGQWVTPYTPSPASGLPLSLRTTDYGLDRYGLTSSLQYTLGNNDIEVGVWGENSRNNIERNYFDLYGAYTDLWTIYDGQAPFYRAFLQHYTYDTRMAYAEDTLHLMDDRLTVNFGAKSLRSTTTSTSLVPTAAYAQGSIKASKGFLPQAGVDYRIDSYQDVYASYSKNIDAYGALPFATSQTAFDASKHTLKPEGSQTLEAGYRVRGSTYEAAADLYYTRFSNRLLQTTPCSAVQTCASQLNNVGSVDSRGVDLSLIWRPVQGVRWLNTLSYDSSKYQDDYLNGGVVATKGKYVVGIPSWMATSALSYRFGGWDFTLDGKYTGKRYITYTNDSSVPSYVLFNAGLSYDLGAVAGFRDIRLALNVTNLAGKHYFATTGTNGYVASDPYGYNQTLQAGAPRQAFFNVSARL